MRGGVAALERAFLVARPPPARGARLLVLQANGASLPCLECRLRHRPARRRPQISRDEPSIFRGCECRRDADLPVLSEFPLRPLSAPRAQAISDYKRILRPGRRAI